MKTKLKRVIYSSFTVCLVLSLLWYTGRTLMLKRTDGITTMQNFYAQEKNTVDLLMLGSSHSGMNLDTETLWTEYGIPSYALWGSVQPFWNSYHFLVEALKSQSPKVVVLDTYASTLDFEYSDEARQVTNIMGMRLSLNKFEAIKASAPEERRLNLLFGFPIFHQRYSELTEDDFAHFPWSDGLADNKGTGARYGVGDYDAADVSGITEKADLFDKEEQYLRMIIGLCKERSIPIVLITTPTVPRASEQPYYNSVAAIAEHEGVPYYNFNLMDEQTGFTSADYWTDNAHLNTAGARRISSYLGGLLKDMYQLPDRRGDALYSSWDVNAVNMQNSYITQITANDDYFRELKRNGRSLVLIKNSSWETNENYSELLTLLSGIGVDTSAIPSDDGGVWSISNTVQGEFFGHYSGGLYSEFELDGNVFAVDFKDGTGISLNGKTVAELGDPGMICAIYDNNTHKLVDIVHFTLADNFVLMRK